MLQQRLHPELYHLWFEPIRAVAREGDTIILEVADDFCELWLKNNYLDLLEDALLQAGSRPLKVGFKVAAATVMLREENPSPSVKPTRNKGNGAPAADDSSDLGVNPKNTFETFVVGDNNSFAHAAALALAQNPGKSYNPLFLYGGVGLGKTHLLHAIGQEVFEHRERARVVYLSSEKFTNDYIAAIKDSRLEQFRKKYRQTDMLLIDDIQFLAGKERIQEEFFHTFNALREAHKQIVLTCDRPANEIRNLEQRLVSRFEWGLVTDLQPPGTEVRLAILRKKQKSLGVELPAEVIDFLANRIRTNIRRLEGGLVRVASYASLTGKRVDVELAESLLRDLLFEEGKQAINVELIQKQVAKHFDIRMADMSSKRRPENIAFPRQIAMYLSRELTDQSLNAIGEAFGGRDHGTVLHAHRLVTNRMDVDDQVQQTVNYLAKQLQ